MRRNHRESILEIFGDGANTAALKKLKAISAREWSRLLDWMDASGFALYFLARITEIGAEQYLPPDVLERLQQNLHDNRERTSAGITELLRIQEEFAKAGIEFLLLKGLSLVPQACPDAALRLQLDIDLLVDSRNTYATQTALATLGYQLSAVSGTTWEYKTPADKLPNRRDLYKPKHQRSVEIHVPPTNAFQRFYQAAEQYAFEGCAVPVLSAVERFLGQAEHIEKHMRDEWSRVSWLLEFRNNIQFYRLNAPFWQQVREATGSSTSRWESLGAATALARTALPSMPEIPLLREAETDLPPVLKLWINHYGRRVLTADYPGSKLYLLQPSHTGSRRRRLLPLHAPQSVATSEGQRNLSGRMQVLGDFARHTAHRGAFHLREALLYAIEFVRWQQLLALHRSKINVSSASASAAHRDSRAEASL